MAVPDRIEELKEKAIVTGIDFIYIYPSQLMIDVYFYPFNEHPPAPLPPKIKVLLSTLVPGDIRIYNEAGAVPDIKVDSISWTGDNVLQMLVAQKADFTLYKLKINDRKLPLDPFRIDPYYNDVSFSFKANCPSDLDCKPPDHECPFEEPVDFPIDYSARDFWSYRRALLEFASLRYPGWPDRLAADAGVMLAEVMSATGDEMAYYQDRVGREAYLETATQRRSIRRHARLVDYHIHDGLGSFAWIDVTVKAGMSANIFAGTNFWALSENGLRTDFEVGENLEEAITKEQYFVDFNRNQFIAYRWDDDQLCLPVGTTDMYIDGHHKADLLNFAGLDPSPENGKWVLLKTTPANPAQPARAFMVRLISVTELVDPVFTNPITHLIWDENQALPFELDMTVLFVRGNMIPSTSGKTFTQYFITGAELDDLTNPEKTELQANADVDKALILSAIEREGSNDSVAYYYTLINSEETNVVWLGNEAEKSYPEIHLDELEFNLFTLKWQLKQTWTWKTSLVGVNSSGPVDTDYTLDDGSWRRVVGYWRKGQQIIHYDYASGSGTTIRFGNDEFGIMPSATSVFRVKYRLGGGSVSNLAPEVINIFDASLVFIDSISNPLNVINGKDPEVPNHVKQSAPEAFRTITYRAVRPEDYAEAAERLIWVQKAGCSFRYTGSWLTAFVTPDPKNAVMLTDEWRKELFDQLNRFRQAGREAFSLDPLYADIDLEIDVCCSPDSYPGEVKERIMIKLFGKKGVIPVKAFFSPDRFTFGDLLERSQLEAAIQNVPGVKAVENIRYRRRGVFDWKIFDEYFYDPGKESIIRVENDLLHPERGILKIHIHGGA